MGIARAPREHHMSMKKELNVQSTKAWILPLASLASFMIFLDAMVVTTALSTIRRDLGASIEALEWTVNAYNLSFAVLLLTGAVLGDRFGRRRMFAVGLGLFIAASAACALAGSAGWLIAARAAQGAGAALVMPLAMTLLSTAFPPEERAKALGIFSSVSGLALIAGPAVGGAIAGGLAWQWIFWINIPIGLIIIPLALGRIPESFGPNAPLDMGGPALGAAAPPGGGSGGRGGAPPRRARPPAVGAFGGGVPAGAPLLRRAGRARRPTWPGP